MLLGMFQSPSSRRAVSANLRPPTVVGRRGDLFLFFLPPLLFFFFRNGILKQPATKANSPDNGLNNLHNARVQEEDARQPFQTV